MATEKRIGIYIDIDDKKTKKAIAKQALDDELSVTEIGRRLFDGYINGIFVVKNTTTYNNKND